MSNSIALAKFSSLLDSAGVMVNDTAITSVVDSAYIALRSPAGSGGLANLVEDTTPQLGGDLDVNDNLIKPASGSGKNVTVRLDTDNNQNFVIQGDVDGTFTTDDWYRFTSSGLYIYDDYGDAGTPKFSVTKSNGNTTISGSLQASGLAYPTSDGSNNQVLTTDGSGNLSWSTPSTGTSNSKTIAYNIFFGG